MPITHPGPGSWGQVHCLGLPLSGRQREGPWGGTRTERAWALDHTAPRPRASLPLMKGMTLVKLLNPSGPSLPWQHNGECCKSIGELMCVKVAGTDMWQRAGFPSVIGASNFPYCNLATLCLAWGLPGLWWVCSKCSLPSSAPLLCLASPAGLSLLYPKP